MLSLLEVQQVQEGFRCTYIASVFPCYSGCTRGQVGIWWHYSIKQHQMVLTVGMTVLFLCVRV